MILEIVLQLPVSIANKTKAQRYVGYCSRALYKNKIKNAGEVKGISVILFSF